MVTSNMSAKEVLNYAEPKTDLEKILYEKLKEAYEELEYANQELIERSILSEI